MINLKNNKIIILAFLFLVGVNHSTLAATDTTMDLDLKQASEWWKRRVSTLRLVDKEKSDLSRQYIRALHLLDGDDKMKPDMKLAVDILEKVAVYGHICAQKELAFCFWNGEGTSQDKGKAVLLWCMASVRGCIDSQNALKKIRISKL